MVSASLSSVASTAIVNILPSDDAFGVLNFTRDSISRTVEESASVTLTVTRSGGMLGPVTVYWKAIGPHQDDLIPMEGNVELPTGKETAMIQLRVANDAVSFVWYSDNFSRNMIFNQFEAVKRCKISQGYPYGS